MSASSVTDVADPMSVFDKLAADLDDPTELDELIRRWLHENNPAPRARFLDALRLMLKQVLPRALRCYYAKRSDGSYKPLAEYIVFALDDASYLAWRAFLGDNTRWSILNELRLVQPDPFRNRFVLRCSDDTMKALEMFDVQLFARHGWQIVAVKEARFLVASDADQEAWKRTTELNRLEVIKALADAGQTAFVGGSVASQVRSELNDAAKQLD